MTQAVPSKPRRSVREDTRAAFRQSILDASMRVFGNVGFHDAKITDIATEAGVATGTLYNYFTSKEEIFQSILNEGRERLQARLLECESVTDPIDRLRTYVHVMLGFLEQHGSLFAIYMQVADRHTLKRDGDVCDDAFRREFGATLERALVEAGDRVRRDHPPELLAALFGGLVNGLIIRWIESQFQSGLQAHTDTMIDFFFHGAAAR